MERIAPALQRIAARYADRIPVLELADLCCTSVAQLRRLFHQAVRQSPQDYITRFRLGMAVSLLGGTTLSILDISCRVGYTSVSSFNRHFRSEFGISPRQWRSGTGGRPESLTSSAKQ
jgi:AraC family transcriptional regulator, activator of mtrCDE